MYKEEEGCQLIYKNDIWCKISVNVCDYPLKTAYSGRRVQWKLLDLLPYRFLIHLYHTSRY